MAGRTYKEHSPPASQNTGALESGSDSRASQPANVIADIPARSQVEAPRRNTEPVVVAAQKIAGQVAWNVGPIGINDPVAMNGAGSNSVVWRAS